VQAFLSAERAHTRPTFDLCLLSPTFSRCVKRNDNQTKPNQQRGRKEAPCPVSQTSAARFEGLEPVDGRSRHSSWRATGHRPGYRPPAHPRLPALTPPAAMRTAECVSGAFLLVSGLLKSIMLVSRFPAV